MFWAEVQGANAGGNIACARLRAAQTRDTRSRGFVALINRIASVQRGADGARRNWPAVARKWRRNWTDGNWKLRPVPTPAWLERFHFTLSRRRLTVDRINGDAGYGGNERDFFIVRVFVVCSRIFLSFFFVFLIRLVEPFQIRFFYTNIYELSFIISSSTNE